MMGMAVSSLSSSCSAPSCPKVPGPLAVDFFRKMQDLRATDSLCDFTLTTEDGLTEERVHKVILAASSDFFDRLFKHEKAAGCLEIACRGPILKHIVDFIYTGSMKGPNEDLLEIYRTAHFLLLDRLCEKWLWVLETKWLNKNRLTDTFMFANEFKLDPIKTVCVNFVFSHFSEDFFLNCPLELVADVLAHEELQISDEAKVVPVGCDFELAVWEMVCRWVEQHPENREAALARLTSVICLQCLPEKEKEKVMAVCREKFSWNGFQRERFILPEGSTKEEILKKKRKFCCPKNLMLLRQYAGHQYPEPSTESELWPGLSWQIRRIHVWVQNRCTTAIRLIYANMWAEDQTDLSDEAKLSAHFGATNVETSDPNCTMWTFESSERIVSVSGLVDYEEEEVSIFTFKTSAGRILQTHESHPEEDYGNNFEIRSDAEARGRHQNYFQGFVCGEVEWPTLVRTLWATYNESPFDLAGIAFGGNRMFCVDDLELDDDEDIYIDRLSEDDGFNFSF